MNASKSLWASAPSVLSRLLSSVDQAPVRYGVDDVYKLAALLRSKDDPLGLQAHPEFISGFQRRCLAVLQSNPTDDVNPFQRNLLESVLQSLPRKEASASPASLSSSDGPAQPPSAQLQEHINAIMAVSREISASRPTEAEAADEQNPQRYQPYISPEWLREVEVHMNALQHRMNELDAQDIHRLATPLAIARYQNYEHIAALARRACKVCPQLPPKDLVRLFQSLHKLHVQDSLTPIVNSLCRHVSVLSAEDTYRLLHTVELQPQTNAATLKLVGPLVQHAVQRHLDTASGPAFHRALLVVLSQYQQHHHQQMVQVIVRGLQNPEKDFLTRTRPHDLIVMLQCLLDLKVPAATLARYTPLFDHLEKSIGTMDIRDIDNVVDIISLLPIDSEELMRAALNRLDTDAGKLTIPQLVFLLDLLSTYPPAKGHVAIVSMAYAAAVQGHAMDAKTLQSVLVSLATLRRFSEDFVALFSLLVREKGGFRDGSGALLVIFSCLTPDNLQENPDLSSLLKEALKATAGHIPEAELPALRRAVATLGLSQDQSIVALLSSANRGAIRSSGSTGWRGGAREPQAAPSRRGR